MVRVRHSRQFHARAAGLVVLAALATGCKSGSWGTKPSWWSFGGPPSASALTAAPSFEKDKGITKPSEAAKPYPITNTPEGYALSDATKTDPARPAESQAVAVAPTAVTYGASPPAAAAQTSPAAVPAAVAQTSVGPQVGPYASLQPQSPTQSPTPPPPAAIDPAGAATAGMAAAPAFGEAAPPMAQVPTARPPAARYADASGGQAWPPAAAPVAPAATAGPAPFPSGDDRYGVSTGSRFGGTPADFAPPPAGPAPTAPLEAPAVPPPAAPPITPAAPATVPAGLAPAAPAMTSPAAVPSPAAPGGAVLPGAITPPTRRADPGYRPGGTSSYRPSKTILAGEEAPAPGVLPASFEAPAAAE